MEKQVDQLVEAAEDCGRYATTSALHIKAVFTRNRTRRQILDHHEELVDLLKLAGDALIEAIDWINPETSPSLEGSIDFESVVESIASFLAKQEE